MLPRLRYPRGLPPPNARLSGQRLAGPLQPVVRQALRAPGACSCKCARRALDRHKLAAPFTCRNERHFPIGRDPARGALRTVRTRIRDIVNPEIGKVWLQRTTLKLNMCLAVGAPGFE